MINLFKKEKKEKKFVLQRVQDNPERSRRIEKLFESEGQLAIDVYQTEKELVIQSAIAGIKLKDLDISIEKDKLTIRGKRERPLEEGKVNYFYQECYWGPFLEKSFCRSKLILPEPMPLSKKEF